MSNDVLDRVNRQEYQKRIDFIESCRRKGIRAHARHIKCPDWMKPTVRMYVHVELEDVIELYSEPFDTLEEAKHFADCFNDNFLANAECVYENGEYVVYSGYQIKTGFMSYKYNDHQNGAYYLFRNDS